MGKIEKTQRQELARLRLDLEHASRQLAEIERRTHLRLSRTAVDEVAAVALMDAVLAETPKDAIAVAAETPMDVIAQNTETRFASFVAQGMSRLRPGRTA